MKAQITMSGSVAEGYTVTVSVPHSWAAVFGHGADVRVAGCSLNEHWGHLVAGDKIRRLDTTYRVLEPALRLYDELPAELAAACRALRDTVNASREIDLD